MQAASVVVSRQGDGYEIVFENSGQQVTVRLSRSLLVFLAREIARAADVSPCLLTLRTIRVSVMRTATIEEARAKLGDAVDLARLAGEPTMITRHGRPAAVVVGVEWYRLAEECLTSSGGREADATRPAEGTRDAG